MGDNYMILDPKLERSKRGAGGPPKLRVDKAKFREHLVNSGMVEKRHAIKGAAAP